MRCGYTGCGCFAGGEEDNIGSAGKDGEGGKESFYRHVPLRTVATGQRPKIVVLHSGGGDGAGFQNEMLHISSARCSSYELVVAPAPYNRRQRAVWVCGPPGGKNQPTTDPANFALQLVRYLDQLLQTQGPFAGLKAGCL